MRIDINCDLGEGLNNGLTNKAWPKERMLLSVCSKMYKEGKICVAK